ncbi:LOW QUALITY PROTEIN: Ribonuclease 3 [Frankliniella fusca]|uniref:Ribonuclease 3 n=1 Tax=Frankliniella fusca TaxID=407009 RepID=A0AAE1L7Z1_9NEOP|nr:LOW QUALITY PROTEIN: Ribonuclease 3 [Frankliniella fusca]
MGRIALILYDCDDNSVHFVWERLQTHYRCKQRLYEIGDCIGYTLVSDKLLSYYPMTSRLSTSHPVAQLVKLKHAIVCTEL